jgi:hypothetical protein
LACTYPNTDPQSHQAIVAAYKTDLLAAGFTVQSENSMGAEVEGGLSMLLLAKDSIQVSIMALGAANGMTISIVERE